MTQLYREYFSCVVYYALGYRRCRADVVSSCHPWRGPYPWICAHSRGPCHTVVVVKITRVGLGGGDAVDGDGHTSMKGRHIRKSEEPITRAEIGASCVDYYMSQYLAA